MNMGVLGAPNKNFSNFTIALTLLLMFFPSSKAGFLDGLKNAWHNLQNNGYPFTSTIQLTNHIKGSPLTIVCVLDEGIRKIATIKPGQTFSFEFQERSLRRNHMMCFMWQRGKEIGWFLPLYYGSGPCEKKVSNIWSKNRNLCKRQLYLKHAMGAQKFDGEFERFDYEPIRDKWWYAVYPDSKPSL